MASIKYADLGTMERVASYVNSKLAFASVMPESPIDNQLVMYVGETTSDYTKGGVYQYNNTLGAWELINFTQPIILTYEEFLELPQSIQESGHFIVEDYPGIDGGGTIEGYYNSTDGKFYEDDQYTTEIPGEAGMLYVGLDNDTIYRYDESDNEFVVVGGGNGTVIQYVNVLPVTGIEDIIYGIKGYNSFEETIADGFLDENVLFEKENDLSGGYVYTPAEDVVLDASDDGTTYKGFTSLAYDGTSDWTLTFDDTTDVTLADGDTFYFRQSVDKFFAGDAINQKVIPFGSSGGGGDYAPGEGITINNQVISVAPATTSTLGGVKPDDSTIKVDANGELSGGYTGGFNVKIDGNTISTKTFVGTLEEWNNLTSAQKAKFDTVSITDDGTTPIATPGHEVLDSTDTPLPQRTNIQFEGAEATDDSVNDITKITVTPYTAGDGIAISNMEIAVNETRPSTFVGTTAEWEALSATEKNEYTLVNLTDDGETGDEENYSTSEVRTNKKWIDGKPIYRLTFQFKAPSAVNSNASYNLASYNIKQIISEDSRILRTDGTQESANWDYHNGNHNHCTYFVRSSGLFYFEVYTGSTTLNADVYVTIEYTKTTD